MPNPASKPGLRLGLASYNVHNLGRQDVPEPAMYVEKLRFITGVVVGLDADLVVVNEIREEGSFAELAEACGSFPGRLLADARAGSRELHTGMMTRLRVLEQGQWHEFPAVVPGRPGTLTRLAFSRPVPWMKVELENGQTLFAAGVHLKSRRPETEAIPESEPARRQEVLGQALAAGTRVAEAGGLRCILDEAMVRKAADHFAVLGDFNDPTDSVAVSLACGRRVDDCEAGKEDECLLFPAAWKMDGEQPYSYAGAGRREMIDQILVSRGLFAQMARAGVESRLLTAKPEPGGAFPGSDHAPVWEEFELREETENREQV